MAVGFSTLSSNIGYFDVLRFAGGLGGRRRGLTVFVLGMWLAVIV